MEEQEQSQKTEKATPRRRQKAREKGQVARSKDLTAMAGTGGVLLLFAFGGSWLAGGLADDLAGFFSLRFGTEPLVVLKAASATTMSFLAPVFLGVFVLSATASVAQGGFFVSEFKADASRVSPGKGMKRIYSVEGALEAMKTLLKFLIGAVLFYYLVRAAVLEVPALMGMEIRVLTTEAGRMLMRVMATSYVVFFMISVISYLLEIVRHERSIRMTKEEVKREFKETEGDPLVKSRVRSIQHEMARRRMMQEVPSATVVVTNPVHLAVALKYVTGMKAPSVVAKGAGHVAGRIKDIAQEHNVPVMEDKPLAQLLFKVDLGALVPEELYKAVAKIIAMILKLRQEAVA